MTIDRSLDIYRVPALNSGGRATLPDVAKLGLELLSAFNGESELISLDDLADITQSGLNPNFGLGFWLNADGTNYANDPTTPSYPACGPTEVVHGIGYGRQLLTVVPKQQLVVAVSSVVGGPGLDWPERLAFWDLMFEGQNCQCTST